MLFSPAFLFNQLKDVLGFKFCSGALQTINYVQVVLMYLAHMSREKKNTHRCTIFFYDID